MITQTIRTSKYTTTIDIPAEKLQTKTKFIQISKNSPHTQEIITIPNNCYDKERQKRQISMQTKLMIEELQQAYNEDVKALEDKISGLKSTHEIEKLKLQNVVEYQKREVEIYKKRAQEAEIQLNKQRQLQQSKISNLQIEIRSKEQAVVRKNGQIEKFQQQVKQLQRENSEKSSLLSSKFKDFETEKDRKFAGERRSIESQVQALRTEKEQTKRQLQKQLDRLRDQTNRNHQQIDRLENQNRSYNQQVTQMKKLNQFQTKEIQSYIQNLKELESQKAHLQSTTINLHQKIEVQTVHIQKILDQMRQQRIYIETHAQGTEIDMAKEEIQILRNKLDEYSILIEQNGKESIDNRTQYLLKLKEIDDERQIGKRLKQKLSKAQQQISSLNNEIKTLKNQQQHLKNELTKKILEYNELLTKPPEYFEVKIEKTIEKKEYIRELQVKVAEYEAVIEQLRVENQSYIEEIQRKVKEEQLFKSREQTLLKSNQELKSYISHKERSIGWAVEREIMKDVEISKNQSQNTSGYKVFVRNSNNLSENGQNNADITPDGINLSVESKIQHIIQRKKISYEIQLDSGNKN